MVSRITCAWNQFTNSDADIPADVYLKALQGGCFRYFQIGGNCIDGPIGLLAGIIRNPLVLIYHFLAVAMLGIWLHIQKASAIAKPYAMVQGLAIFATACAVIIPYIVSELRS